MDSKRQAMRCVAITLAIVCGIATTTRADDESFEQQRQRLTNMSATEKETLRHEQQRFERLAPSEREKLRQLDKAIADDTQGDRLRQVMRSYSEWLRALPSSQRIELVSLPAAERVERVKVLLAEQERRRFQELFGSKLQLGDQKVNCTRSGASSSRRPHGPPPGPATSARSRPPTWRRLPTASQPRA